MFAGFPNQSPLLTMIRRIDQDGVSAIKFEAARPHFVSNVFVDVVVAQAPHKTYREIYVYLTRGHG